MLPKCNSLNSEELGRSCDESVRVVRMLNSYTHFVERLGLGKTVVTKSLDEFG